MLVPTHTPVQAVNRITSKGEKFPGRLTSRLRLMPRLRMNGAIILPALCLRGMHKASAEIVCYKSGDEKWKVGNFKAKRIFCILVSKVMLLNTFDIEIYLSLSHGTQKWVLSFWCLFVLRLMRFYRFVLAIEQFNRTVMYNSSTTLYTRKAKFKPRDLPYNIFKNKNYIP